MVRVHGVKMPELLQLPDWSAFTTGCRSHLVDMDLSKFFDRVNHDRLLSRLATRVRDKRVLKLIRRYLTAGTMIGGLVSPSIEGTPQGGPLSPLLSNIVLDELDKELEKRGHQFVRYADDFRIYCKSDPYAGWGGRGGREVTPYPDLS